MLTKKFFCPVNDWDCPYWKEDGSCHMVDKGWDPVQECTDVIMMQELLNQGYHFVKGKPMKPLSPDFIKATFKKIL